MSFASLADQIKNPFTVNAKSAQRPNDFPDGFEITEYVDGALVPGSGITLVGNMMPFQPFEWGGEQRLVKEYYPGNPEPAVQILGAKEGSVNIKGRFKDKKYSADKFPYGISYQFNLIMDGIRKRGNLVKFGMHSNQYHWIRWGIIEKSNFKMNKLSWIDYELEFFVISETQPRNNYFLVQEKQNPFKMNSDLLAAVLKFQTNPPPPQVKVSLAFKMNQLIGQVAGAINTVTGFVNSIVSTAKSIEASANRAMGLIKNAQSSIYQFKTSIDELKHGFGTLTNQPPTAPAAQARDTFNSVAYIQSAIAGTKPLSNSLAQMLAMFEAIALTLPIARYVVRTGDTLQSISIKFYGVSDNWINIYQHNQLSTTALTVGVVLEIPKV